MYGLEMGPSPILFDGNGLRRLSRKEKISQCSPREEITARIRYRRRRPRLRDAFKEFRRRKPARQPLRREGAAPLTRRIGTLIQSQIGSEVMNAVALIDQDRVRSK